MRGAAAAGRGAVVPAARRAAIRRRWGWLAHHHVGREGEGERGRGRDEGGGGAGRGRSSAASEETERGDDGSVFFAILDGEGEKLQDICVDGNFGRRG